MANSAAPNTAKAIEFAPVYAGDAAEMLTDSTATFGAGLMVEPRTVTGVVAGTSAFAVVGATVGAAVVGAIDDGGTDDAGTDDAGTDDGGTVAIGYCCAEAGAMARSAAATITEAREPAETNRNSERGLMHLTIGVTEANKQAKNPRRVAFRCRCQPRVSSSRDRGFVVSSRMARSPEPRRTDTNTSSGFTMGWVNRCRR